MSHVINMYRLGNPKRTSVSDLSNVILCLVVPRFENSNLVVCTEQHNHSAIPALSEQMTGRHV